MSNPRDLPNMDVEESRHKMFNYAVGGLYPSEVKEAVDQHITSAKNPVIVDLGCGQAFWSAEIAEKFPSAQVIGISTKPPSERPFPPNFSFKQYHPGTEIPNEFKASGVDIVHCRMVLAHFPDPQAILDSLVECLKPGGFLFIAEGNMEGAYNTRKNLVEPFIYDPSMNIEDNLKNPKQLSWHSGCVRAFGLSVRPPTYQPPQILVQRSKILKEIMIKDCWVPIYWEGENLEYGKELKPIGIENVKRIYRTASNVFSKSNLPEVIINALLERGMQEASEGKTYLRGNYVVARKPVA